MAQYFEERPRAASDQDTVELTVGERTLALATDSGVFSRHRLDPGTAVLLRKAPAPPPAGVALDLGCGYGPIACALAVQSPDALVWAIDVNERARELTARNAGEHALTNVTVAAPDDVPAAVRFDTIYSNPPIRIGKEAMHALLDRWLPRLVPGHGRAYLVVQKHLGADSLQRRLEDTGFATDRLASSKGYRVLEVRPRRSATEAARRSATEAE
ncbi:MAG TPA: methyltransferase [Acidimicrobiia bacterium]|nr:methyltransferase [Acidimicrobiia bacterium]